VTFEVLDYDCNVKIFVFLCKTAIDVPFKVFAFVDFLCCTHCFFETDEIN